MPRDTWEQRAGWCWLGVGASIGAPDLLRRCPWRASSRWSVPVPRRCYRVFGGWDGRPRETMRPRAVAILRAGAPSMAHILCSSRIALGASGGALPSSWGGVGFQWWAMPICEAPVVAAVTATTKKKMMGVKRRIAAMLGWVSLRRLPSRKEVMWWISSFSLTQMLNAIIKELGWIEQV